MGSWLDALLFNNGIVPFKYWAEIIRLNNVLRRLLAELKGCSSSIGNSFKVESLISVRELVMIITLVFSWAFDSFNELYLGFSLTRIRIQAEINKLMELLR